MLINFKRSSSYKIQMREVTSGSRFNSFQSRPSEKESIHFLVVIFF